MSTTATTDWRTMEAGHELNAIVAGAMGHMMPIARRPIPCPDGRPGCAVAHYGWFDAAGVRIPSYSKDTGAAFQVVAEVQRRNPGWRFSLLGGDVSYGYVSGDPSRGVDRDRLEAFGWKAEFMGHIDPEQNYGERHGEAYADTPALAICRAALAALGDTERGAR